MRAWLIPGALALLPALGAAAEPEALREGAGREVTQSNCVACHSLEYIPMNAPAMDRTGWQKSVQKMRERFGAPITDAEAQQILDYLDAHYSGKP